MPLYEWRCADCRTPQSHYFDYDADRPSTISCPCGGIARRRFSFAPGSIFHSHYNDTVGDVVTSHADFKSKLARASDERSERTGIPHSYSPVDIRDLSPKELGMDD